LYNFLFSNSLIEGIFLALWGAFVDWWWLFLPFVAFYVALEFWINYNQEKFKESIEWINLELKIPQDVLTTPKVMDQVFTGLSVIASTPDTWLEELLDRKIPFKKGEVPLWVSFEILGTREGISFIIHTPKKFKNLIEAQFRSQYPQVEITEIEDYVKRFSSLPNNYYNIWAAELTLNESPVFPIKTYEFFEERVEERRLDSMAPFLEVLSGLENGEEIWMQMVLRGLTKPLSDSWKEKTKKEIDKLLGKKEEAKEPGGLKQIAKGLADESANVVKGFAKDLGSLTSPQAEPAKEEKKEEKKEGPSGGERMKVERAENKVSKTVFEAVVRVIYLAPKASFEKDQKSAAINSYFRSFTLANLNGFKNKRKTRFFLIKWVLGDSLDYQDANNLFKAYESRLPDPAPQFALEDDDEENIMKKMIFATDELATLYHFPLTQTGAPRLYRVQTKKYEPPPNLPVI